MTGTSRLMLDLQDGLREALAAHTPPGRRSQLERTPAQRKDESQVAKVLLEHQGPDAWSPSSPELPHMPEGPKSSFLLGLHGYGTQRHRRDKTPMSSPAAKGKPPGEDAHTAPCAKRRPSHDRQVTPPLTTILPPSPREQGPPHTHTAKLGNNTRRPLSRAGWLLGRGSEPATC